MITGLLVEKTVQNYVELITAFQYIEKQWTITANMMPWSKLLVISITAFVSAANLDKNDDEDIAAKMVNISLITQV